MNHFLCFIKAKTRSGNFALTMSQARTIPAFREFIKKDCHDISGQRYITKSTISITMERSQHRDTTSSLKLQGEYLEISPHYPLQIPGLLLESSYELKISIVHPLADNSPKLRAAQHLPLPQSPNIPHSGEWSMRHQSPEEPEQVMVLRCAQAVLHARQVSAAQRTLTAEISVANPNDKQTDPKSKMR
jgi:hypothetical protein